MQIKDYKTLQATANEAGEKVNPYIKKAIAQRMERERDGSIQTENKEGTGGSFGFSEPVQEEIISSQLTSLGALAFTSGQDDKPDIERKY